VIGVLAETTAGWRGGLVLVPVLAAGIAALMPLLARPRR
jgi:hypothetical protein